MRNEGLGDLEGEQDGVGEGQGAGTQLSLGLFSLPLAVMVRVCT